MAKKQEYFVAAGIGAGTTGQLQAYLQHSLVPALNRFVDKYNALIDEQNQTKRSKDMTLEEVADFMEETSGGVHADFFKGDTRAGIKRFTSTDASDAE